MNLATGMHSLGRILAFRVNNRGQLNYDHPCEFGLPI